MKSVIPFVVLALAAVMVLPACRASGRCCPSPCDAPIDGPIDEPADEPVDVVPVSTVVGTWEMDVERLQKDVQVAFDASLKDVPEEQREMARGMMDKMLEDVARSSGTITLKSDGTWSSMSRLPNAPGQPLEDQSASGTWSEDGGKIKFTITNDAAGGTSPTSGSVEGDVLTTNRQGMPFPIVFNRMK